MHTHYEMRLSAATHGTPVHMVTNHIIIHHYLRLLQKRYGMTIPHDNTVRLRKYIKLN